MNKSKKYILIGITSLILIYMFLIPRTYAQEWLYNGADTEAIPNHSVYPSEWYVYNASGMGVPADQLQIVEITHANITDPGIGNCITVWGHGGFKNTTSGEVTLTTINVIYSYWNESLGYYGRGNPLLAVENDGKVSARILNNASTNWAILISPYNFEHQQIYPNFYSIAFWNSSNGAYFKINWTEDGIQNKWRSYKFPRYPYNVTLHSRPAQLPPEFSFKTKTGSLDLDSTEVILNITITDADNNNDEVIDMDYLYRIRNGTSWTDWATPPSQVDWDFAATVAGDYDIIIEVKNMYGVAQEQITITYTPPGDGDGEIPEIPGYSIILISIALLLGVSFLIQKNHKKI